jgi:hypothetical protein
MTDKIKCGRCMVTLDADKFKMKRCGNRQKICIECCEKFVKWKREHEKTKEFKCTKCEFKCSNNSNLKGHINQVHDKIRDFKCDKCDYKCSRKIDLKRHIKAVHDKIKDFECDKCEFKCCTNGELKIHIKAVHDKIKDFECDKCEFKCSQSSGLTEHIKAVHDKIRDFKCDKCNHICSNKANLQSHIKQVHDKIRDFDCDKCDYKCSHKYHLTAHIKTCTGKSNLSSGEFKLQKILTEMKVDFTKGSYELRNPKTKSLLQWDIIIKTDSDPLFIEYDGRQHFQEVKAWGKLEYVQYRDKLKNDYCNDNGYLLLRIPYTQYENMEALVVEFIRDNTDWGYE